MADRKKKRSPAGLSADAKAQAAMTADINRSTDEWRASQGLPPIDRDTGARSHPPEGFPR